MRSEFDTVAVGAFFASLYVALFAFQGAVARYGGNSVIGASRMMVLASITWVLTRVVSHWLFKDLWSPGNVGTTATAGCWAVLGAIVWMAASARRGRLDGGQLPQPAERNPSTGEQVTERERNDRSFDPSPCDDVGRAPKP